MQTGRKLIHFTYCKFIHLICLGSQIRQFSWKPCIVNFLRHTAHITCSQRLHSTMTTFDIYASLTCTHRIKNNQFKEADPNLKSICCVGLSVAVPIHYPPIINVEITTSNSLTPIHDATVQSSHTGV